MITNILESEQTKPLVYFGHVNRMTENRLHKRLYNGFQTEKDVEDAFDVNGTNKLMRRCQLGIWR